MNEWGSVLSVMESRSSYVLYLQLSCKFEIIFKQKAKKKKAIAANSPLENDKIVLHKGNQLMIVA